MTALPQETPGNQSRAGRDLMGARHRWGVPVGLTLVALLAAGCASDASGPAATDACETGSATTLAVGAVQSSLSGTSLCAAGGSSGAEYVLIPFNASPAPAKVALNVTATGVTTAGSAAFSIVPGSGAPAGASRLYTGGSPGISPAFEARLRAREATLDALIPAARARAAQRTGARTSRAVIPVNVSVGQRLELNTNSEDPCAHPVYTTARVVAVTNKSIVVADTANPGGGFTDADYQSFAETFDNVVDPLITSNFGAPADVDNNGRILLFFTRSVNELTPEDNNGSYVGGFFFGRDLFPPTARTADEACASSNFGELFYLLVPDPTGLIHGNEFTTADVREIAISIVAHEYQHLINASRRMYISTTAEDFEETWLNEGLSHVAEELLFYEQSELQPKRNLDVAALRASAKGVDAFNADQGANFGRFKEYLDNPSASSPYADDDSLSTRGATWSFLRYAVDHQSAPESSIWFQLVNSGKTGLENLRTVFGAANLPLLLRDWSTANFADDVPGVAARYQQPSWNFRSIYTELYKSYPLQTFALADGVSRNVQIAGGGSAYLRFKVPAGAAGQVKWGTVPATMQMTLLRTR